MRTWQGGCGWSVAAGTGLVVARKVGGSWTPPSALGFYSCGWGFQFGGVVSDLLIVLRNQCAPLSPPRIPWHAVVGHL